MAGFSLRDWQRAALTRMLRLSTEDDDAGAGAGDKASWSDEWKVLVYDADTRAIISPLLPVGELRALGVTLHLNIDAARDIIPDVAAVFFVKPTPLNLRYIADDAAAGRYREFFVNFASPIPRPLLETFARGCVEGGAVPRIRRVVDAYQSFVSLEARLFHLNMKDSYAAYARPDASEADIRAYASTVASGLLGLLSTCGPVLPVIIAQPGGPAALIAAALDAAIRDHLSAPGSGVFGHAALGSATAWAGGRKPVPLGGAPGARPALLLFDRGLDLATPLAHASSYAALVDDTVGPLSLNRVTIPEEGPEGGAATPASSPAAAASWLGDMLGGAKGKGKTGRPISLDSDTDAFWRGHAVDDFPAAIEAHERELREVQGREEAIRRTAGAGGDESAATAVLGLNGEASAAAASDLVSAIDSLPALLKRRRILEAHAALMSAVMTRVASRLLPSFYDLEVPAIAGTGASERSAVLELVADARRGWVEDRARLAAVHLLTCSPGGAGGAGGSGALGSLREETEALVAALTSSVGAGAAGGAGAPPTPVSLSVTAELDSAVSALRYLSSVRQAAGMGGSGLGGHGREGSGLMGMAAAAAGAVGGGAGGRLLEGMARATTSMLNKAAGAVSRALAGESRGPLTRAVASVCEGRASASGLDSFLVFVPRAGGEGAGRPVPYAQYVASAPGSAAPAPGFRSALAFVVGGGCYSEYVELQRYAAGGAAGGGQGGGPTVVYGGTELLHPSAFLTSLSSLGGRR